MKDTAISRLVRHFGYPCLVAAICAGATGAAIGLFAPIGYTGRMMDAACIVLPGFALLHVIVAHIEERRVTRAFVVWVFMTLTILIALWFGVSFGSVFWRGLPFSVEDAAYRFRDRLTSAPRY